MNAATLQSCVRDRRGARKVQKRFAGHRAPRQIFAAALALALETSR